MARSIHIRTEIPGPRSRELLALKERYVANAITIHAPVFADRAEGALIAQCQKCETVLVAVWVAESPPRHRQN